MNPGAVALWLLRPDDVADGEELDHCHALLSAEESLRADRFRFPRDRRAFVVARAFMRTMLGTHLGVAPGALRFRSNAHGRPLLAGADETLSFNLSHTHGFVLFGVAHGCRLGVDVERLDRPTALDVAADVLSAEELARLEHAGPAARNARFLEHWTLKEAYAKALSVGLSLPLRQLTFLLTDRGVRFSPDPGTAADAWTFWQFVVDGRGVAAVCGEAGTAAAPALLIGAAPGVFRPASTFALSGFRSSLAMPAIELRAGVAGRSS